MVEWHNNYYVNVFNCSPSAIITIYELYSEMYVELKAYFKLNIIHIFYITIGLPHPPTKRLPPSLVNPLRTTQPYKNVRKIKSSPNQRSTNWRTSSWSEYHRKQWVHNWLRSLINCIPIEVLQSNVNCNPDYIWSYVSISNDRGGPTCVHKSLQVLVHLAWTLSCDCN